MIAAATTVIDVWRDTDADDDDYDEIEDPDEAVISGEPASIIERTQRAPDVGSGDLRAVRANIGRVRGDLDVRQGDRIYDQRSGFWYAVTSTSRPQNPAMLLDLRLELTRTASRG